MEAPVVQVVGAALPMLIYGKGAQPAISYSTSTIPDLSSCFSAPRKALGDFPVITVHSLSFWILFLSGMK